SVTAPQKTKFLLSEGDVAQPSQLRDIAQAACQSFQTCPEAHIPRLSSEIQEECQKRRASQFRKNQADAVRTFTRELGSQWPCERPRTPASEATTRYIKVSKAMTEVLEKFKVWHDNLCFYEYLENTTAILAR
ncbi:uncharacterized protein BDR25DRAFT_159927, partial [Lindgomyces ingoldianus]